MCRILHPDNAFPNLALSKNTIKVFEYYSLNLVLYSNFFVLLTSKQKNLFYRNTISTINDDTYFEIIYLNCFVTSVTTFCSGFFKNTFRISVRFFFVTNRIGRVFAWAKSKGKRYK